jgi:hypothetical protein
MQQRRVQRPGATGRECQCEGWELNFKMSSEEVITAVLGKFVCY